MIDINLCIQNFQLGKPVYPLVTIIINRLLIVNCDNIVPVSFSVMVMAIYLLLQQGFNNAKQENTHEYN